MTDTKFDPHAAWESLMQGVREVIWKERKNRIRSPLPDPIPGYTEDVGVDKFGKPLVPKLRGRYVKYAFDSRGMLSIGKPKGRENPHRSPREQKIKNLCVESFKKEFESFHSFASEKLGEDFLGVSPEDFVKIADKATVKAKREFYRKLRSERKERNARSLSSRQINRGLIQGADNRIAHAQG
jgi:hypothetical protein